MLEAFFKIKAHSFQKVFKNDQAMSACRWQKWSAKCGRDENLLFFCMFWHQQHMMSQQLLSVIIGINWTQCQRHDLKPLKGIVFLPGSESCAAHDVGVIYMQDLLLAMWKGRRDTDSTNTTQTDDELFWDQLLCVSVDSHRRLLNVKSWRCSCFSRFLHVVSCQTEILLFDSSKDTILCHQTTL